MCRVLCAVQVELSGAGQLDDASLECLLLLLPGLTCLDLSGAHRLTGAALPALLLQPPAEASRPQTQHPSVPLGGATHGAPQPLAAAGAEPPCCHQPPLPRHSPPLRCLALRSLALDGCSAMGEAALGALCTRSPHLERLSLRGCPGMGDAALAAAARCCANLRALDLTGTRVGAFPPPALPMDASVEFRGDSADGGAGGSAGAGPSRAAPRAPPAPIAFPVLESLKLPAACGKGGTGLAAWQQAGWAQGRRGPPVQVSFKG